MTDDDSEKDAVPTCSRCQQPLQAESKFCLACGTENDIDQVEKIALMELELHKRREKLKALQERQGSGGG